MLTGLGAWPIHFFNVRRRFFAAIRVMLTPSPYIWSGSAGKQRSANRAGLVPANPPNDALLPQRILN
jgi:hypothetical protein